MDIYGHEETIKGTDFGIDLSVLHNSMILLSDKHHYPHFENSYQNLHNRIRL